MPLSDDIGLRGEAIFIVRLTQSCGPSDETLFRPHFLGEKCATLDYLVELMGEQSSPGYFFVQVKTTTRGFTSANPPRLRVSVTQRDVNRMLAFPAPTYLVGIDASNEQAFIASANGTQMRRISSMPAAYPLNQENLRLLHSEVATFWMGRNMILSNSAFAI